ncbi:cell death abnormality protein 1-like [Argopecten irradians]|uniref:cell death abnormality protein 1-like n=1 Tax=Argopecten irradians TaxID=31199 RepID=UPI0037107E0B
MDENYLPCKGLCCANAYCDARDNRCKCNQGYWGIGTVKCFKPCNDACGSYALCGKDNKCYCEQGYYGNPYKGCYLPCHGLCKDNARCDIYTHKCYCKDGFFGNPLKGCQKPGSLTFTKTVYTAKEDVGVVQVSVTRAGFSFPAVTVYWQTQDGTAKQGLDYGNTAGTIYFASGETTKTVNVYIIDDSVYETTEFFTVVLKYVSAGGVLGSSVTAKINILDNDDPCGGPCPRYSSCDEKRRKCVCDDGYNWDATYRACVRPCNGRCCANAYCDKDNTCKCKPGYKGLGYVACYKPCRDACKQNAFCGSDDRCCCNKGFYGNPYVGCTPPCNNLCKANARCDIPSQTCECLKGFHGDPKVGCQRPATFVFATPSYSVNEDTGSVSVTVNRIGSKFGGVTVTWVATDISAKYGPDYLNNVGNVYFAPGVTSVSFIIYIRVDKIFELDEKFKLTLTQTNPTLFGVVGSLSTTIVTIHNDDKPCGGPCGVNSHCDMPSQRCVCDKNFILWDGVCGLPCDGKCCAYSYCSPRDNKCHCNTGYIGNPTVKCYKPCNNACRLNAFCGKDNKCYCKTGYYGNAYSECHLPCHDKCLKSKNTKCDIPSQKCVCLPGYYGEPYKGGCHKPSLFIISQSIHAVNEKDSQVDITVKRIGSTFGSIKVTWAAFDGTAVHGLDYINTGGILFFGDGDNEKDISIHIINDDVFELKEKFSVKLTKVTEGGSIGPQHEATVFIENDDERCEGKCVHNAYCNHDDNKCYCNKGLVGNPIVKCELPCGGHCGAYAHSHCNYKTNKCECDDKYSGDPYHGGCVCTSGGHGGSYGGTGGTGGYETVNKGY